MTINLQLRQCMLLVTFVSVASKFFGKLSNLALSIWRSRSMSLIASLINYFQITISGCLRSGTKGSFFHEIDFAAQLLFKFTMHAEIGKQTYWGGSVELHKYVYVGTLRLLTTGIGAENPSFQNGLRLEIVGYLLCHSLCTHTLPLTLYHLHFTPTKVIIIFVTPKRFRRFLSLNGKKKAENGQKTKMSGGELIYFSVRLSHTSVGGTVRP